MNNDAGSQAVANDNWQTFPDDTPISVIELCIWVLAQVMPVRRERPL